MHPETADRRPACRRLSSLSSLQSAPGPQVLPDGAPSNRSHRHRRGLHNVRHSAKYGLGLLGIRAPCAAHPRSVQPFSATVSIMSRSAAVASISVFSRILNGKDRRVAHLSLYGTAACTCWSSTSK